MSATPVSFALLTNQEAEHVKEIDAVQVNMSKVTHVSYTKVDPSEAGSCRKSVIEAVQEPDGKIWIATFFFDSGKSLEIAYVGPRQFDQLMQMHNQWVMKCKIEEALNIQKAGQDARFAQQVAGVHQSR